MRYETKFREGEDVGHYGQRLAAIKNWCHDNLHRQRGGSWDILDINLNSMRGGHSVFDICYFEFRDPEVASIVALKFGL